MDCSPPSTSVHGDSPGQNTGVGCHVLHQGVFPTQGSNPHILVSFVGRWGSLPLAPSGKPSISHTKTQKYSCIKIRRVLFAKIQRIHITCNTNLHVIKYITFKYTIYLNLIDINVFYITGVRVRKFLEFNSKIIGFLHSFKVVLQLKSYFTTYKTCFVI